ncbi:hypothetical protein J2848_001507 [Azospirillum lipoferum]|uniref:Uncharacterized protein n=1 Tax=Azospirillum lipoferum TaxID=193 RepID=A0A5A9GWR5_AZOLI|nr:MULTISPECIES: hypothetical protein [Azospirillum]KAA0598004.1 hypothetical protein FZ942_02595 [Azospirillum lipoferum]MCP1609848.1 hypothetical protein [Azospirillum lipoferum]MDW5534659.1 hypothetical protein [Azospirillum sp. NL1]
MRTHFIRLGPVALAMAAGLFATQTAAAQTGGATQATCGAMVEQFAADMGLSTEPPPVAAPGSGNGAGAPGLSGSTPRDELGSGSGSEQLAQSGGMVAPPAIGDRSVVEPPAIGSNMPTAPSISPQASPQANSRVTPDSGPGGSGGGDGLMGQAARNAQVESLVTAARSAARDGDETRCMNSLNDARRLSRTAPGGHGG